MFIKRSDKKSGLDEVIDTLHSEMVGFDADSEEYSKAVDQLTKLYEIKKSQLPDRLSKDTLAIVICNLLGIALIVAREEAHVVTSKALGFVINAKMNR